MGFPDLRGLFSTPTTNNSRHKTGRLLPEPMFIQALRLERMRAERSRRPFVLMLLDLAGEVRNGTDTKLLAEALPAILASIRETDIAGWPKESRTLGVIFAELGAFDTASALAVLRTRVTTILASIFDADELAQLRITFYCFPDDWKPGESGRRVEKLYPDLVKREKSRRASNAMKRVIDLLGSSIALVLLSPVLLIIALTIKLSSPGPVLFRQKRIGQYGVPFPCLKFRSMHTGNDPRIHMDYVKGLIGGKVHPNGSEPNGAVYKITEDPRLTSVGRLLRKVSLDELPQLINVLRGEMSLVGPRPPIPYELEAYDIWHRRRLMEVRPGITGLWQVSGRSRVPFDDMVRLDLKYAKERSLWLDVKILFKTPHAVLSGNGAY